MSLSLLDIDLLYYVVSFLVPTSHQKTGGPLELTALECVNKNIRQLLIADNASTRELWAGMLEKADMYCKLNPSVKEMLINVLGGTRNLTLALIQPLCTGCQKHTSYVWLGFRLCSTCYGCDAENNIPQHLKSPPQNPNNISSYLSCNIFSALYHSQNTIDIRWIGFEDAMLYFGVESNHLRNLPLMIMNCMFIFFI